MFFIVLIVTAVFFISVHIASYGLYVLKEKGNRRGGWGTLVVALMTFLAPVLSLLYQAVKR